MKVKSTNIINLTPLNPNVSLGKDNFLQGAIFPRDKELKSIMNSDNFKQLLFTDASTNDGQDFLAGYYKIEDWVQIKQKFNNKGLNMAARYYYLLCMVKAHSKQDNVWISFYEGLH
jgi:hypothetical protein